MFFKKLYLKDIFYLLGYSPNAANSPDTSAITCCLLGCALVQEAGSEVEEPGEEPRTQTGDAGMPEGDITTVPNTYP